MRASKDGYQPFRGYLTEQLEQLSELKHSDMPTFHVIEYDPLIDSSNVTPEKWQQIINDIARYYHDYDGFVILHGTDTMAYTASALSFLLENLAKPVILTGSQLPLEKIRNDARENIINAVYVASHYQFNEVALYFHDVLLRGNRSKKISSVNYAGFDSPNFPPLARIETQVNFSKNLLLPLPKHEFVNHNIRPANIAAIKLFPGMQTKYLEKILDNDLDAIIVGTYGQGNAPTDDKALIQLFRRAEAEKVILVNCTQCPHGTVNIRTYATGNVLAEIGFVSAFDMTIEAVIGKLYFLLSCDLTYCEIKRQMEINLCGELTLLS